MRDLGWRGVLRWLLGLAALAYLLAGFVDDEDREEDDVLTAAPEPSTSDRIRIVEIRPDEPAPGGTVVLELAESFERLDAEINDEPAELVTGREHQWVFRLPDDIAEGPAKIRVLADGRTSKKRRVEVKSSRRRKILRNVLGGLALVVLGMRTLATGVRRRVGAGWRRRLSRLARATPNAVGWGSLAGGVTQTGATVAALTVSALQSKLLGLGGALAIMVGAQLGASVVGALLPFAASKEALVLVGLGVAWLLLARDRRGRGAAQLVLGAGLLFHGLYLLRIGLGPMVDAPELIGWLSHLDASTWKGRLLCAGIGAILCAILQGPGPAFVAVLGIVQSTSLLGLDEGLAVLAGTAIGTGATAAVVAWPFGDDARRFGHASFWLATLGAAAVLVTLPIWISFAAALTGTDPEVTTYGKKLLHPTVGAHLTVGFVGSQLLATFAAASGIRLFTRKRAPEPKAPASNSLTRPQILELIAAHIDVLDACHALGTTGDRAKAASAERLLADLERRRAELLSGRESAASNRALLVGIAHVHRTLEELLRTADKSVESGAALEEEDRRALDTVHRQLHDGMQELSSLDRELDLEDARAREIRINAIEARSRQRAAQRADDDAAASPLLGAYEAVGNQVFRLAQILVDDE